MKILVISTFPPLPMADADYAYRLCRNLADAGHEVHVLCQKGAIAGDLPGLHTHGLMEFWNWREAVPLIRLLRQLVPDAVLLIYTGNAFQHYPMLTFSASLTRKVVPRARFVTVIPFPLGAHVKEGLAGRFHQLLLRVYGRHANAEYGTLLRDSAHLVTMSMRHLPSLERYFPDVQKKSTLIPPAVIMQMAPDDAAVRRQSRNELGIGEDDFLFAYFGYLYATKGLETLLAALRLLRQRHEHIKLAFVGGGDEYKDPNNQYAGEIKRLIVELGLAADVQFTGGFPWDSDKGSRFLRAADAAVLPFDQGVSLNNSSFASVIAHGLPTVTTYGDVLETPIIQGGNAVLCRPRDAEALAAAMETIVTDSTLRSTLKAGAEELARTCFSWPSATERFVSILAGTQSPMSKNE